MSAAVRRLFPYVSIAVVAATVVAALVIIGSPAEERSRRLDGIRRTDLRQIAAAIDVYWQAEGRLPESLEALDSVPNAQYRSRLDPETARPYRFRPLSDASYELCATFASPGGDSEYEDRFWAHPAAEKCFQLDVKKRK